MTSYDPRGNFGGQKTELTKFDKLAVSICWFGALIIIGVHVIVADRARSLYSPLEGLMPGLTKIVTSPGYAVSMAMLMAFLGWYGSRMRRLYDNQTASTILFFGLLVSIAANGLLIWGVYAPAGRSMQLLGG
ncbi:MAG TPA: hypothetical protein RMH85_09075 [Polyangiaceae bacterium LLY-WYZ-15_(1-7)]|nr:hypothetical protein [Myxococcales bacterium]MAT28553.1 hypothetical protein [Sandaracinus sp.]HJK93206.1 hypothetical protein [Polyangiaceae bacterium LLY-WYZ-15_(1-7)]MBJ74808.1 hypothetical protein [Sandaracinus sp.]HJL01597.1 hypothetical protein [Polyangiaceae bacterium LLY-WYZ-15_(1-7)]